MLVYSRLLEWSLILTCRQVREAAFSIWFIFARRAVISSTRSEARSKLLWGTVGFSGGASGWRRVRSASARSRGPFKFFGTSFSLLT